MDLEKQIGDSLYHMSIGGKPELYRDDEGGFSVRQNPMPYLREPMRQAEPKDQSVTEALTEIPFAAGGMVKGAAEGIAGLGGDIEGIVRGIANVMSRGEGESVGEAFGRGFDEATLPSPEDIREKIDPVVMPLVPEDQQELVQEAADVGQMTGLPGAGLALKGGVKAAKKFRAPTVEAPTDKKPGIIAFHGSADDFDEFKIEKIGTGEGAQAYGYGLYFTDSENIARFYKSAVRESKDLRQGASATYKGKSVEEIGDDAQGKAAKAVLKYITQPRKTMLPEQAKQKAIENLEGNIKDFSTDEMAELLGEGASYADTLKQELEDIKNLDLDDFKIAEGKMYKVALEPDPEEMIDYQIPFNQQTQKVQDALISLGYNPTTEAAQVRPMPLVLRHMQSVLAESKKAPFMAEIEKVNEELQSLAAIMDKYEISYRRYSDPRGQEAADKYDDLLEKRQSLVNDMSSSAGRPDKLLSEKLYEKGVPGVKYRAAGSRGADIDASKAEMNYVIFDDKMIKILEKYGIAGPVAISAVGAATQEGETDAEA
jgi:hypothetical protein